MPSLYLSSLYSFTALPTCTEMCSKHNEASHTILSTAAGEDVAPNCVEASGIVLSKHTKDLQHQSMKMKGQILRPSACMRIALCGIKQFQHCLYTIYIY